MKFKPVALIVIGLLLGSSITMFLKQSPASTTMLLKQSPTSTAEILACINKNSLKVRLTVSGTCDVATENMSPVSDLWSLQPTTPSTTTTTVATQTKTYVIDGNGKSLGLLTDTEGREAYWVQTDTGKWRLSLSDADVSGILRPINSLEGPLYIDAGCTSPLFRPISTSRPENERAVVEIIITKNGKTSISRRGFRIEGELIGLPKIIFGFGYSEDYEVTCAVQDKSNITDQVPKKVYKSKPVDTPTYKLTLKTLNK